MNDVMAKPHWFNWFHIAATWWDAGKWAQIHLGRLCINSWIEKYGDGVFGPHMMQRKSLHIASDGVVTPKGRAMLIDNALFSAS